MTGETKSYGFGGSDVWIIKTDVVGDVEWTKVYGGHMDDAGWSVRQTLDGGYIIAGYTNTFGSGAYDMWIIKTDSYGNR